MKRATAAMAALIISGMATAQAADMQFAIPFNENNEFTKVAIDWTKAVAAETGGKVTFKPALNGALVSMPETLDALSNGVVQVAMGAASFMSGTVTSFGYIEMLGGLPLTNPPTGEALSAVWPQIEAVLAQQGVKPLWATAGFGTAIACRNGFVKTLANWQGKKVRVAGRWQSQQVKALGAAPMPLPPPEIYVGLQNGVLDCTLLTPSIYTSSSLFEVAPYFTMLDLVGNATIVMMGMDVWKRLPDDQKAAITRVSTQTTLKGNALLAEWKDKELEVIKKKAQLHVIAPEVRAEILAKFKPLFTQLAADTKDAPGKELVKALAAHNK